MNNSAYHTTAYWIVELLELVRKSLAKQSIKDWFIFVSGIKNQNGPSSTMSFY